MCLSNWSISPRGGSKSKMIWNHHLEHYVDWKFVTLRASPFGLPNPASTPSLPTPLQQLFRLAVRLHPLRQGLGSQLQNCMGSEKIPGNIFKVEEKTSKKTFLGKEKSQTISGRKKIHPSHPWSLLMAFIFWRLGEVKLRGSTSKPGWRCQQLPTSFTWFQVLLLLLMVHKSSDHQLRLVVYSYCLRGFFTFQVVGLGISEPSTVVLVILTSHTELRLLTSELWVYPQLVEYLNFQNYPPQPPKWYIQKLIYLDIASKNLSPTQRKNPTLGKGRNCESAILRCKISKIFKRNRPCVCNTLKRTAPNNSCPRWQWCFKTQIHQHVSLMSTNPCSYNKQKWRWLTIGGIPKKNTD